MKKRIVLLLVIMPIFLLAGCTQYAQNSKNPKPSNNAAKNTIKQKQVIIKKANKTQQIKKPNSSNTINGGDIENKNAEANFYGNWEITKLLTTGPVLDRDISELKAIIGKKIVYSKDFIKYDTNIYYKPSYKKTLEYQDDFESGNRVSFKKLGIKDGNIIEVNIYTDNQYKNYLNSIGNMFYIKDKDSLILYAMGGYFELKRVNEAVISKDGNIIDKNTVKVGDKILDLIVKSIDIHDGYLEDISFSGNIQVIGAFEWEETGDGKKCIVNIDNAYKSNIPILKGANNFNSIVINNNDLAQELLPQQGGKAVLLLNNYSLGERQIPVKADLERVIEYRK